MVQSNPPHLIFALRAKSCKKINSIIKHNEGNLNYHSVQVDLLEPFPKASHGPNLRIQSECKFSKQLELRRSANRDFPHRIKCLTHSLKLGKMPN